MRNWRIQAYLLILTFRHLGMASLLIFDQERFETLESFRVLFSIAHPAVWGVCMTIVGAIALASLAWSKQYERLARIACIASVGVSLAWASSIGMAHFESPSASLLLFIIFLSMGLKDLIISSMSFFDPAKILEIETD